MWHFKILLLLLVTIFITNKRVISYKLNKCCPLNHVINSTMNGCVENQNNKKSKDWNIHTGILKELSKTFTKSIPNIDHDMELHIPCSSPKTMVLMWMDGNDSDFHIDKKTGDLKTLAPVAKNKTFNIDDYCLDEMLGADNITLDTVAIICQCTKGVCVNYCCEKGKILNITDQSDVVCIEDPRTHSSLSIPGDKEHFPVYGMSPECPSTTNGPQLLNEHGDEFLFKILPNGSLYWEDLNKSTIQGWVHPHEYCIDSMENNEIIQPNAIICGFDAFEEQLHANIYSVLFMIGAFFLLATLIVHALLPELRRAIQGLSLMAHCACMLIAHLSLTLVQLKGQTLPDIPCHILAYVVQYSILAGFFWLNVMCIDIASTFRSLRSMAHGRYGKYKKFLFYSIYAMGLPFIIFLITYISDALLHDVEHERIKPNIGVQFCWFDKDQLAILIFFYGPLGLVLLFNLILFVFAALKIIAFTRNPELYQQDSQRHDKKTDRKRIVLFLKLFGLMGIPWIFEILSWAIGGKEYYWYFTDAINLLRSVFIFFMFCWKRQVWNMLTKRHPKLTYQISNRLRKRSDPQAEDNSTATSKTNADSPTNTNKSKSATRNNSVETLEVQL